MTQEDLPPGVLALGTSIQLVYLQVDLIHETISTLTSSGIPGIAAGTCQGLVTCMQFRLDSINSFGFCFKLFSFVWGVSVSWTGAWSRERGRWMIYMLYMSSWHPSQESHGNCNAADPNNLQDWVCMITEFLKLLQNSSIQNVWIQTVPWDMAEATEIYDQALTWPPQIQQHVAEPICSPPVTCTSLFSKMARGIEGQIAV